MDLLGSFKNLIGVIKQESVSKDDPTVHTHTNKEVIDTITSSQIYAWGKGAEHAGDDTVHVTSEEKNRLGKMVQLQTVDTIPDTLENNTIYVLSSGEKIVLCDENGASATFSKNSMVDILETDPIDPSEGYMWIN